MPRQPRIEYEGAIYHVMNRGDRREEIVRGDHDREAFVGTLAELARRLRKETTVSLKWIAENLLMGTWTHVANLLRPARPPLKSVKDKD